ncbi:hypothetical protein CKAN_00054700 [Cinnamomum micranthum f. kanehirae]|uniref:Uncharacterized protein n=1 Tax=Cinnamomum micranthum f. kanehirae TaxID=337451 RepID=A0A3S3MEK0_9MAGN|nr:hypothetical protein CKAN_00054700 [Cinnamomum micranthum f. kanehirae]
MFFFSSFFFLRWKAESVKNVYSVYIHRTPISNPVVAVYESVIAKLLSTGNRGNLLYTSIESCMQLSSRNGVMKLALNFDGTNWTQVFF